MNAAAGRGQTEPMRDLRRLNDSAARLLLALLLTLAALPLHAGTRAWLDRDRIQLGETATLNVETGQSAGGAPDWSPLEADFEADGHTSTRRVEVVDGEVRTRVLYAVALRPRREGVLTVPPLQVQGERTEPLALTVLPARDAPAQAGAVAFVEAELETGQAWVQQAIGYVLRLHYATPLVSGELEQQQPEGAALRRIGDDLTYSREIGGRRYNVVERRFLLVPERSGTLDIPAARFRGRGTGGFFDDIFGSAPRTLQASSEPQRLQVRPMPDPAPRPWLPLRSLQARFLEAPREARAGEAVDVVVELRADGAAASQIPDLELRADEGAQVFPEPPQAREQFDQGRPQVVVTRRFSIVPRRAGTLQVHAAPVQWWDVRAGVARTAALPPLSLEVQDALAAPSAAVPAAGAGAEERWIRVPGVQGEVRPWAVAAAGFALLWLATLIWGLHRRPQPRAAKQASDTPLRDALDADRARLRRLRLVLDTGDLGEVEQALCALATPPPADVDALRARLGDPAQLAALEALQRARWAGGDPAAARSCVREAFAKGPRWAIDHGDAARSDPLPPLYPGQ